MHLMYIADPADPSKRIYTLQKVIDGKVSKSAHPARFSPDDKYSRHRVTIKKRYGLLLTQQSKSSQSDNGGQSGQRSWDIAHELVLKKLKRQRAYTSAENKVAERS